MLPVTETIDILENKPKKYSKIGKILIILLKNFLQENYFSFEDVMYVQYKWEIPFHCVNSLKRSTAFGNRLQHLVIGCSNLLIL